MEAFSLIHIKYDMSKFQVHCVIVQRHLENVIIAYVSGYRGSSMQCDKFPPVMSFCD